MNINTILENLNQIIRIELDKTEEVRKFQEAIWSQDSKIKDKEILCILQDLALDLSYYVYDVNKRLQDSSYFGNERCNQEIKDALYSLEQLGQK